MSGPMHFKVDANTTMSFKNFDDLTSVDRKYNKGTLVLENTGKTKTLSCVNHHHIGLNLTKVSQRQIKDLRTEFGTAVREELDAIALKLAAKNPGQRDEILAKFKAIGDLFDKKILMSSWNKPPQLSRMDIRAFASDVKKLRYVTVDCLLQLNADELSSLSSDDRSAAKARSVSSGKALVARRDVCLDQLRLNIGKCDENQLEATAEAIVKTLMPNVNKLLEFGTRVDNIQNRLKLFFEPDDQLLDLKNIVKNFESEFGMRDLDAQGKSSGRLTREIADFEKNAKAEGKNANVSGKTILFAIGLLKKEVNDRLTAAANKVNKAFMKCGIKTFTVATSFDQFLISAKDGSDLGALKADVCKLARALGALPPDKDTDRNGLGQDVRIDGTKLDEDEEAQAFRAAFGGKNEEAKIIDNLETVRVKMSEIVGSRQTTVRWSMSKVEMTSGDIKPMEPTTVQERLASRKDYVAKILDSLRTMVGSGPKDLEARRALLGRICDDMFEEFAHLVDSDRNAKRKMFARVMENKGYQVVKEIDDEDFEELYDENARGDVDLYKETVKGRVNDWKASILAKVKAEDNLAAMVRQVQEALGVCPNELHVVFDDKAQQEKRQTVDAVGDLARAVSDKAWNGDWDAAVKQHVLPSDDK